MRLGASLDAVKRYQRALAILRQTPFMVFTYVLSAAPLLIAFTTNPQSAEQCCVSDRTDCAADVPCGCFVNATALLLAPRLPSRHRRATSGIWRASWQGCRWSS